MENLEGSGDVEITEDAHPVALRTESEDEGEGAAEIEPEPNIDFGGEDARAEDDAEVSTATAAIDAAVAMGGLAAGNELSDDELLQAITALIYASPEPLSERRLIALLEGPEPKRVEQALSTLKMRLAESRLPLQLVAIAGGWQIVTAQEMAETVQRLFKVRKTERVSPAALETLAVVAYRQPVTKAEIEAIRGVQVGPILRALVDRGFMRVTGRADVPGHPLQYGTTRLFLERFGLATIDELPRDSELAKG